VSVDAVMKAIEAEKTRQLRESENWQVLAPTQESVCVQMLPRHLGGGMNPVG
jgi:hypothetical protein